jgi:hypothetical protein
MERHDVRRRFILEYIRNCPVRGETHVNVLHAAFVDAYVEKAKAPFASMHYGAHKCPALGRDLSRMHKEGLLIRKRVGLLAMAGMGFPNWVWCYELAPHLKYLPK